MKNNLARKIWDEHSVQRIADLIVSIEKVCVLAHSMINSTFVSLSGFAQVVVEARQARHSREIR
jgi:hypothetical protein